MILTMTIVVMAMEMEVAEAVLQLLEAAGHSHQLVSSSLFYSTVENNWL
jgi:hypothetical protein